MKAKIYLLSLFLVLLLSSTECHKYDHAKYAIGLFAAYALNDDGNKVPCMGTCYGAEKEKCRFGWSDSYEGKDCKITEDLLVRHYTKYNWHHETRKCMSRCERFGNYPELWCVNEDDWWKCIKDIPRNVTRKVPASTKYQYYHCLDACSDGWCYIYPSSWEYCDPSKTVFVTDNPTTEGTRCETRCGAVSEKSFKCYDTNKNFVNCYPSPDGTKILKSFHKYVEERKHTFNDDGKLISCNTLFRKRRDDDYYDVDVDDIDTLELESIFDAHNSVEEMAIRLENIFTTETIREVSDYRSANPILRYTVRIVPTAFDQPQIILPLVVRARYSTYTRPTAARSSVFDEINYINQAPRPGLDDHGHIAQYSLGGTNDPYNIVPQSTALNRGGPWGRLERIIRDYIRTHPTGTVDHIVVINYDFTRSYRPTSFAIRVRFYDGRGNLVNEYGQPLNSFSETFMKIFILLTKIHHAVMVFVFNRLKQVSTLIYSLITPICRYLDISREDRSLL
uniref:Parasitoid killing factor 1 n=1 Tax=Spodoptera exigua TaxID=7107 RepID=A0A866W3Y0_SPOEX|nr:parasitoid killing factor 1 [Spodoptera exigua]